MLKEAESMTQKTKKNVAREWLLITAGVLVLTAGTAFCLVVGVLYLWPPQWLTDMLVSAGTSLPHFMLLSFYLFVILMVSMTVLSMTDSKESTPLAYTVEDAPKSKLAIGLWIALAVVMVGLYIYFN